MVVLTLTDTSILPQRENRCEVTADRDYNNTVRMNCIGDFEM